MEKKKEIFYLYGARFDVSSFPNIILVLYYINIILTYVNIYKFYATIVALLLADYDGDG